MSTIGENIYKRRLELNMTQAEVAEALGYKSSSAFSYIESDKRRLSSAKLTECAKILKTTTTYLINGTNATFTEENIPKDNVYQIPIYGSASAGFGTYADDAVIGYEPVIISNPSDVAETMCIKVSGDSMSPKIEDGDLLQVIKTTSVDSGDIAIVLIDETEAVVKKVIYGSTWIELRSLNPRYKIRRFENSDVLKLRILGRVQKIIKTL